MIDLQKSNSLINLAINKVGVKDIHHPVTVALDEASKQHTVATFDMYVSLNAAERGTHMSRFLEILNSRQWELSIPAMDELSKLTQDKLKSDNVFINTSFKLFLAKYAPVTKAKSLMDYDISLGVVLNKDISNFSVNIKIPVTTLCPCSKALSKYNAHNQRSYVSLQLSLSQDIDLVNLIKLVESSGSCGVFAVLKREDEKFVTETAYENPKFVEDIAREVADSLYKNSQILNFTVEVENLESIHNHSAYARIDKDNVLLSI